MPEPRSRIREVSVEGLHGTFDYQFQIPESDETVIIIAPNGYGKTALLSLINDCLSLNLLRAAKREFRSLTVGFADGSRWEFERKIEEDSSSRREYERIYKNEYRRNISYAGSGRPYQRGLRSPFWIDLHRYNSNGTLVEDQIPNLSPIERRNILRTIERTEPWLLHLNEPDFFESTSRSLLHSKDTFARFFELTKSDDSIRKLVSATNPKFVWPSIERKACLFIETQRLLYAEKAKEEGSPVHEEEIVRQSDKLAHLLRDIYGEYAATSQALDRSFPNRLIERAQKGAKVDPEKLRAELSAIEQKRSELTDVGILVEQAGPLASSDDNLLPEVFQALQIYVEDSIKKLATYDNIYPKLDVFSELIDKKLSPKKLHISRENGAEVKKDGDDLGLTSLSSGEKHEFIMLFKLAFETEPDALVLIDEPEISLHVVWQLEFMADLARMQGANPFQCIIATHSPQIFQGHKHLLVDLADQIQ